MLRRVAVLVLTATILSGGIAGASPRPYVPLSLWRIAAHVHVCEENGYGWRVNGPIYFGGLGWRWATWQMFRASWFPRNMANATPLEQAWALGRFIKYYGFIPDPNPAACSVGGY